ncbi:hypothetical protein JL722_14077 [Aureococcus anophagefferens]|nr:hypothetical protein JL722_14077 [Aureococcus anophagefferens]
MPRKPKSAEELFCLDKAEQLACREDQRPFDFDLQRATVLSSQATLVADGAKKVEFKYGTKGKNGSDYLERFYGIDDRSRYQGKVTALAVVSIQEKHRISEVVVARFEEVNVARAEAEKPLPPLHVAGASRRLERYKADFALQLKDLAYVEAADEAYLRDQAAALAPPEPMPDGSGRRSTRTRGASRGLANTFGA